MTTLTQDIGQRTLPAVQKQRSANVATERAPAAPTLTQDTGHRTWYFASAETKKYERRQQRDSPGVQREEDKRTVGRFVRMYVGTYVTTYVCR
jgi:hypothetical protein